MRRRSCLRCPAMAHAARPHAKGAHHAADSEPACLMENSDALDSPSSDRHRAARRNPDGIGAIGVFLSMVRAGGLQERPDILLLHQPRAVHDYIVRHWRILLPEPVLSLGAGHGDGKGAPTAGSELTRPLPIEGTIGFSRRRSRRRDLSLAMTLPGCAWRCARARRGSWRRCAPSPRRGGSPRSSG